MKEPAVADSSCLISLERISHLEVLTALFELLVVPPEVQREFGIPLPWLKVENPLNAGLVAALKMLVGDGEAEAIALACERGWRVILDDRQARTVASRLGTRIIGTIGVLVQAKHLGLLPSVRPLLEKLESSGFYSSESLKREALLLVGE